MVRIVILSAAVKNAGPFVGAKGEICDRIGLQEICQRNINNKAASSLENLSFLVST